MHLRTLPSYFHSDLSPMSSSDSPFPPLKVEHRYRGVYERAGFDVNLGLASAPRADSGSLYLKHSTPSPSHKNFPQAYPYGIAPQKGTNGLAQPHTSTRLLPQAHGSTDPAQRAVAPTIPHDAATHRPGVHSAPVSAVLATEQALIPEKYVPGRSQRLSQPKQQSKAAPQAKGLFQPQFQPFTPKPRPGDAERNVRNLSLDLPTNNFTPYASEKTSTDSLSAGESPTFEVAGERRQTPQTSASSSGDFGRKDSGASALSVKTSELSRAPYPLGDLTSELDGLRHDVEQHKKYDPRVRRQGSGNGNSYGRVPENADESSQDDFNNFLRTATKPAHVRASHLSTISSIISKHDDADGAHGGYNDSQDFSANGDTEDDEVQRELERQLQSLKTGSEHNLETRNTDVLAAPAEVPSFHIDTVNAGTSTPTAAPASDSDTETEAEAEAEVDADARVQTAPLMFGGRHAEVPRTPDTRALGFEDQLDTPETIRPLSPKTHRVEEELQDINFRTSDAIGGDAYGSHSSEQGPDPSEQGEYPTTERAYGQENYARQCLPRRDSREALHPSPLDIDTTNDTANEEEILLQHPTPSEFDAFPKSVVDVSVPEFIAGPVSPQNPAGLGPCRECREAVDPHARGGRKAIYSKNGELSGQWHRQCFKCAYAGCDVQFNKHVACYVLLDNAFCHDHYHTLNGTRCQECNNGIEGECIENELKQKWHVSCLKCSECLRSIATDYYVVNERIMCDDDAARHIANKKKDGLSALDKIEKRRTRVLYLDQQRGF